MRRVAIAAGLAWLAASCGEAPPERLRVSAKPPETRSSPVTETIDGLTIVDAYRWLEGDSGGRVGGDAAAWIDAQHRYTRTVLDALPGRAAIESRLGALAQAGTVTPPVVRGNRYFFATQAATGPHPQIVVRDGAFGSDRIVVDPAVLDPSGATAVAWISPGDSGAELAYGVYRAGEAATTLRVIRIDPVAPPAIEIPNVLPGVQWLPDGSGFIYLRLRDPKIPQSVEGVFHRQGTPIAKDVVLFRQPAPAAGRPGPPVPPPFASISRDGRWLLIGHWADPLTNDLWLADFDAFRRTGRLVTTELSRGDRGVAQGTVSQGVVYLHTTKGSPNGRVIAAPAAVGGTPAWRTVVPERADAVIETVAQASGLIAVTYRIDAASVIEVFTTSGESRGRLALPAIGTGSVVAQDDRTEAYLSFSSFHVAPSIWRVDLATPGAPPRAWSTGGSSADASNADVSQVSYRSKDGTRINMFLVQRPGQGRAGDTPTVISGYGGWGVSMLPAYSPEIVQWVEAGGLVAVPTLRGGGEYGQAWHADGALGNKQHAIDDLIAAAEWLIGGQYTDAEHLAVTGDAHGAVVAAAAVTSRPELFRAAVLTSPLTDMIRYPFLPGGGALVREYGDPRESSALRWLFAYSPYHRVRAGTRYPAMLVGAGDAGGPFAPDHARKFVAAVQGATTGDAADRPVLLRADAGVVAEADAAGRRARALVDQRLFLLWQVGRLPDGTPTNLRNR